MALSILAAMIVQGHRTAGPVRLAGLALVSGLIFLVTIAPNFGQYVIDTLNARNGADLALTDQATRLRFSQEYVEPFHGVASSLVSILSGPRILLLGLAGLGAALVWWGGDPEGRRKLVTVLVLLASLVTLSCAVPILESVALRMTGQQPLQLDLIRAVRYVVPLLLLLAMWAAARLRSVRFGRYFPVLMAVFWLIGVGFPPSMSQNVGPLLGLQCWAHGRMVCPGGTDTEAQALINYIAQKTPQNSLIFSPTLGPSIRALARRPLAFDWKDTGWLAYSNHVQLGNSVGIMQRYSVIAKNTAREKQPLQWLRLGRDLGADFVVLTDTPNSEAVKDLGQIVFQNAAGTVTLLGQGQAREASSP